MNMEKLNEFIDKKIMQSNLSTDEMVELVEILCQQETIASAIAAHEKAIEELTKEGINVSKKAFAILGFSKEDLQALKSGEESAKAEGCKLDPAVAEEIDAVLKKHGIVPADAVIIGATQVKTEEKEDGSED